MTKCCCKNPMALLANPCTRKAFDWDRCVSRHKNTGKIWRVNTVIGISSTRRDFYAFAQKLFWDFFPVPDPCVESTREPYITITAGDTNEEQTIRIEGTPVGGKVATGGYFTLKYHGQVTGRIPYNPTASTIESALAALTNIGSGNVTVSGAPGSGSAGSFWTVNFIGELAGTDVWFLEADDSNLIDVSTYEPVPGLSEADTKLIKGVYGTTAYLVNDTFPNTPRWSKAPYKAIAEGVELIIYMYYLRGTWRLTMRYSDYDSGPSGTFDYAFETLRSVAHYTSDESACFLTEPAVFTLDRSNTVLQYNGIEGEQYGDDAMGWPETAYFQTVDVGDFFETVPLTPEPFAELG